MIYVSTPWEMQMHEHKHTHTSTTSYLKPILVFFYTPGEVSASQGAKCATLLRKSYEAFLELFCQKTKKY